MPGTKKDCTQIKQLQKFVEHYGQIYGDHTEAIDGEEGRKRFPGFLYICTRSETEQEIII